MVCSLFIYNLQKFSKNIRVLLTTMHNKSVFNPVYSMKVTEDHPKTYLVCFFLHMTKTATEIKDRKNQCLVLTLT